MSLSNSSLPYKGVIQIVTDSGTKNVCWQSLKQKKATETVCRHLGYLKSYSFDKVSIPTDAKDTTFSGSINCNGVEKYLSQCSINASASESCSELSYIECKCGEIKLDIRKNESDVKVQEMSAEYKMKLVNGRMKIECDEK